MADPVAWADAPLVPLGSRHHHPEVALLPEGGLSQRQKGFLSSKVQVRKETDGRRKSPVEEEGPWDCKSSDVWFRLEKRDG